MAAHITCHSNDCLPNQFPSIRPTARCHGMLSDYSKGHVMSQSIPTIKTTVEGGTTFPSGDDIEPLPMYRRITPVIYNRSNPMPSVDPDLFVTPEKRPPARSSQKQERTSRAKPNLSPDAETPIENKSQRVRFEQLVTVKHISPEDTGRMEVIDIDRSHDMTRDLMCDDQTPFSDHTDSSGSDESDADCLPRTYSYQYDNGLSDVQLQPLVTRTEGLTTEELVPVTSSLKGPISMTRKVAKCATDTFKNSDVVCSDIIDVLPSKMAPAKTLLVESGVTEHVLARPEFNSTLSMSKEVQEMATKEINLSTAIAERLKTSEKIKTKLDEKTYSVLNLGGTQFPGLVSIDIKEDDLIETAAQDIEAKVKPTNKIKQPKPEDRISRPPDIMEFFTPDLQREVPSFSLSHLTSTADGLKGADLHSAFDTYHHIRAWEEW